jgi:dUTP pyrophosphatase
MDSPNISPLPLQLEIGVSRIDPTLPLPAYQTSGAVAFDLYSRIDATIGPNQTTLLPTNLIVQIPEGYALVLAARSSLGKKKGLIMRNGIGVIDQDYHGPQDELGLLLHNFTDAPVSILRGERLGQGLIVPVIKARWKEKEVLKESSRGGFGTTG